MGKVIKGNFGGGQEKIGDTNSADNADKKPADIADIGSAANAAKEKAGAVTKSGEKNIYPWRNVIESAAKESPAEAVRRLNKMTEALNYIASLAGVIPAKLRSGSSYKDNIVVFQSMYLQDAKAELYKKFDDSSKEMWKKAPGYYLALIDTLRRYDWS